MIHITPKSQIHLSLYSIYVTYLKDKISLSESIKVKNRLLKEKLFHNLFYFDIVILSNDPNTQVRDESINEKSHLKYKTT